MSEKVKLSKDGSSIDFVQTDNLPTSLKKFRQSPEIEGFYRFIFENDLQREAYEVLNRIIGIRKAKKAAEKAVQKAEKQAVKAQQKLELKLSTQKPEKIEKAEKPAAVDLKSKMVKTVLKPKIESKVEVKTKTEVKPAAKIQAKAPAKPEKKAAPPKTAKPAIKAKAKKKK
jgi:hypothetical protein